MFKQMIDVEYRVHWLLDNLPVAVRNDELGYVSRGYPVGFVASSGKKKQPQHYLFNHVRIIVRYSEEEEEFEGVRVVGFEVVPFSIKVRTEYLIDTLLCPCKFLCIDCITAMLYCTTALTISPCSDVARVRGRKNV